MLNRFIVKIKQNHFLAMAICCALPMVALVLLSSLGIIGTWGIYALFLLCPLAHVAMMRGMHHKADGHATTPAMLPVENRVPAPPQQLTPSKNA